MNDDERVRYLTTYCAEFDEHQLREELLWACAKLEGLAKGDRGLLRPKPEELLRRVLIEGIGDVLALERPPADAAIVAEIADGVFAEIRSVFDVTDQRTSRLQRAASKGRPNAWQPWTQEFDDDLKRRWFGREPVKDIAKAMGRSQSAITARLVRLGVVPEVSGVPPAG